MALALGCLLGKLLKGKGLEGLEEDKVHTCGGPRRRPGLGEGRGRRIIYTYIVYIYNYIYIYTHMYVMYNGIHFDQLYDVVFS